MIVAERKPLKEIQENIQPYKKLLILGCGTCVSVCMAGGEKEVALTASQLRMANKLAGREMEIGEATIQRQCDKEYIQPIVAKALEYDAVLSMGCGAGVQFVADMLEPLPVIPALNTRFIGVTLAEGMWAERCRACGSCLLADFGGICPIAMCAKSLVNGPCGGSKNGKCETSADRDCGWVLIYNRLKKMDKLDNLRKPVRLKAYSAQTNPARQIAEAYLRPVKTEAAAK
ncbi:MAG: methylenetetrahydrofolate reductase C-terminal domain-containing protein [Chloroflexi bacterium]|nr:methylenetetrahydrofolate reductase C-terminal domain-containing protein [Chloroflexota bacterium]